MTSDGGQLEAEDHSLNYVSHCVFVSHYDSCGGRHVTYLFSNATKKHKIVDLHTHTYILCIYIYIHIRIYIHIYIAIYSIYKYMYIYRIPREWGLC